jgi:hypothetical protein
MSADKIAALEHAVSVIVSKRLPNRLQAYYAALDDVETSLLASIERLKNGEQMESVAVVQSAKTRNR